MIPAFPRPKSGFLLEYQGYAETLTDAPETFHLAVGMAAMATVIEGRVHIPFGAVDVFPNLYCCLLGESSTDRKSYSMSIGLNRLLMSFDGLNLLPNEFSPERLFAKLSENPKGLLVWPEFGSALAKLDRDYMGGTKEFLADIYDCPPRRTRELKSITYVIENPCVSILTSSSFEWLRTKQEDVLGGFFPRFLFIPRIPKTKRLAVPPIPDPKTEARLKKWLNDLRRVEGTISLADIRKPYEKWLFSHEDEIPRLDNRESLGPFWARFGVYALKFAMLYQLSDDSGLNIKPPALEQAIAWTEFLKAHLQYLFADELAYTRAMKDRNRVLRLIRDAGVPGINRSRLMQNGHMLARELDRILDTLRQEGRIESIKEGRIIIYVLTAHMNGNATEHDQKDVSDLADLSSISRGPR